MPPACADGIQAAVAAFNPDVVVLHVGATEEFEAVDLGDGTWTEPCDPSFNSWREAGARKSIQALSAAGATVVVVTMVHLPRRIERPGVLVPEDAGRHVDCNNRALRLAVAAEPRARLLDLDAYVCPGGQCREGVNGITLRPDGTHFEREAATMIAEWLLPQVLDLADLHPRPATGASPPGAAP